MALQSCEKEPLNAECDIESVLIPGDKLAVAPTVTNTTIELTLYNDVSPEGICPEMTLTPGATVEPPSGTPLVFDDKKVSQTFTVTSEDGDWHKSYTFSYKYVSAEINLNYGFEDITTGITNRSEYEVFYEPEIEGTESFTWASGNPGFALTGLGKTLDSYPTFQIEEGRTGKALCLITRLTGTFGAMANKPMAAGNLFMGNFDVSNAMQRPLESTQFGIPFSKIPLSLKGWFKYAPGPTYYKFNKSKFNKLEEMPGITDRFNIYAVMFERTPDMEHLDGTNVLASDNPNIIAVAEIADEQRVARADWTAFDIPFAYRPGKDIDLERLRKGDYSIAVVFSSSIEGDYFSGAPDSRLVIDDVELVCQ